MVLDIQNMNKYLKSNGIRTLASSNQGSFAHRIRNRSLKFKTNHVHSYKGKEIRVKIAVSVFLIAQAYREVLYPGSENQYFKMASRDISLKIVSLLTIVIPSSFFGRMHREVKKMKRLAVIPSDPLEDYKRKGTSSWLERYYNPAMFFDEVYLLSPVENEERIDFGMKIIPTRAKEYRARINELDIDVLRAYGGYWPCELACNNKVEGVPVVVSVHDSRPAMLFNAIKKADVVFCTSEIVKELVGKKRKDKDNIWLLPNRIDFGTMRPYDRSALEEFNMKVPGKYRILHVGRKSREKNLDTVIKALNFLGEDYFLLAIGMGDTEGYSKLAQDHHVLDRCLFIDHVPNPELARYYSWADCLCNPSRSEGFGLVFIEALACETVVVTSDIAPMNEYIAHGENGLLVEAYEDPEAVAELVKKACNDQSVRQRIKNNARSSVLRFEKSRIDELEAGYYDKILEMNRQGAFSRPLWKRIKSRVI